MQKRFIVTSLITTIMLVLGMAATTQAQNRPQCQGQPATLWVGGGGNGGTVYQIVDGEIVNLGDYFSNQLGGYVPLEGTDGNDVIVGSSNNDRIFGFDGDDIICARGGQDFVDGGAGMDAINGQGGDDELRGGEGDDTLNGNSGQDRLFGEGGNDDLIGNGGRDTCDLGESFADTTRGCEEVIPGNLVDVASSLPDFSILVQAVVTAGLADTLANGGPFTVFAPTNQAFADLAAALGTDANGLLASPFLTDILLYHVLNTPAPSDIVLTLDGQDISGLNLLGESLIVEITPLSLFDGTDTPANVTATDVFASNGVIHVIDKVLLPPSVVAALAEPSEEDSVEEMPTEEEPTEESEETTEEPVEEEMEEQPLVIDNAPAVPFCNGMEATLWVGQGGNGGTVYQNIDGQIVNLGDYFSNQLGTYIPLEGTDGNDVIVGSSNNDRIFARGGDDTICAGNAQDSVDGGDGNDTIFGEDGDDRLFGRAGEDSVFGGNGQDELFGEGDDDNLDGGNGVDFCDLGESFADTAQNCEEVVPGNIVEVASSLPDFSILVQAVVTADLADTLANGGPFTVFAPTNQAFADLAAALGTDANGLLASPFLTDILLYHVLSAPAPSDVVLTLDGANLGNNGAGLNLLGEDLVVEITPLSLIDGTDTPANVTATDVFASNGVIHVIDKVLLPPSVVEALGLNEEETELPATVVDIASGNPDFSILVQALGAAEGDLVTTLIGSGPFTVLAPTNAAFEAFAAKYNLTLDALLASPLLDEILLYHVIPVEADEATVRSLSEAPTFLGDTVAITIDIDNNIILDGSSKVVITDLFAENGVVHVIDTVLEPSILFAP